MEYNPGVTKYPASHPTTVSRGEDRTHTQCVFIALHPLSQGKTNETKPKAARGVAN